MINYINKNQNINSLDILTRTVQGYTRRMLRRLPRLLCAAWLATLCANAPAASEPPAHWPPPDQLAKLVRGDIELQVLPHAEAGAARLQAVFHSSAEAVWRVLEDCSANYRFVPGLRDCELLQLEPTRARTRQTVKSHWFAPAQTFIFSTLREPYRWIAIELESGDMQHMRGSWRFDPLPGRPDALLVTHEIELQPRIPAPRWLVRRTLERDLPDMLACLRFMSGGSPDTRHAASDEAHCQAAAAGD